MKFSINLVVLLALAAISPTNSMPIDIIQSVESELADSLVADNVGLRITITEGGFSEITKTVIGVLEAALANLTIPDMKLDEHVPVIGHITLELSDIKINEFSIPQASLTPVAPSTVAMHLGGVTLAVSLNYHWRKVHWPHLSDHGTLDASPKSGTIDVGVAFTVNPKGGYPTVSITTDKVDFDKFDIKFHHDPIGWLLNLFIDLFKGTIKKSVDSTIEKSLQKVVDETINKALAKMPSHISIGGGNSKSDIDLSTLEAVSTNSAFFSLGQAWKVTNNKTGAVCPGKFSPIPYVDPVSGTKGGFQVFLADTDVNCMMWTPYINGALTDTLHSNTNDWKLWIPQLPQKYPGRNMSLVAFAAQAPVIIATNQGMTGSVDFHVNLTLADNTYLATLDVSAAFTLDLTVAAGNSSLNTSGVIYGKVSSIDLSVTSVNSAIGPLEPTALEILAKLLGPLLESLINKVLGLGIPLPLGSGIQLIDPAIHIEEGFLAVSGGIQWNPSDDVSITLIQPPPRL